MPTSPPGPPPPHAAHDPGRGEQDHEHHHEAVGQRRELGGLHVAEPQVGPEAGGHLGKEREQGRADQRAEQAAEAAEHHRGEQGQREREHEAARRRDPHGQRHHTAGQPRTGGAHDEGEDPGARQVDPGDLGGDLVVADRAPGPADPAARQVREQHEGEDQRDPADVGDVPGGRHVVGGEEEDGVGEPVGDLGEQHVEPLLAAEGVGEVHGDPGDRDREGQRGTGEVGPVQPGGGHTDDRADQQRHEGRDHEHADDGQRRLGVLEEQRGGVRPDRHEGAVAERELAVEAGEHGEPAGGDAEVGHRGELAVAEGAGALEHQDDDHHPGEREDEVAQQGRLGDPAQACGQRRHVRPSARPRGRTGHRV